MQREEKKNRAQKGGGGRQSAGFDSRGALQKTNSGLWDKEKKKNLPKKEKLSDYRGSL